MIYFEFYCIIVLKSVLAFKYEGGLEQFKLDIPNNSYQDDEHLACVKLFTFKDAHHILDFMEERGLDYHRESNYSGDFAVFGPMGLWWQSDWLLVKNFRCVLYNTTSIQNLKQDE